MTKAQRKARKQAIRVVKANPAMLPLLELFATVDDVFTTEGAFDPAHINKSLGRCYRAWKKCRGQLDDEFDPKRYPKKPRRIDSEPTPQGRRITLTSEPR